MDEILDALGNELGIDFATRNRTLKNIKETAAAVKTNDSLKIRRTFKRRTKAEIAAAKKTGRPRKTDQTISAPSLGE